MLVPQEDFLLRFQYLEVMDWLLYQQNSLLLLLVADCLGLPKSPKPRYPVSKQKMLDTRFDFDILSIKCIVELILKSRTMLYTWAKFHF